MPAPLDEQAVEGEEALAGEALLGGRITQWLLHQNTSEEKCSQTKHHPSSTWTSPSGQFLPTTALRLSRVPGSRSMLKHRRWNLQVQVQVQEQEQVQVQHLASSWSDIRPSLSISQILKIR